LGWKPQELHHLEMPFSKNEVKIVVKEAPKEKVLDPNGYIGSFFSYCRDIIKGDILKAVDQF
jgi:hypothetical protein